MDHRQNRSCFMVSERGVETASLKRALQTLHVEVRDQTSFQVGSYLPQTLASTIAGVDFVCLVLADGLPSRETMLETGVAIGAGRPLIAFGSQKSKLPLTLNNVAFVRGSLLNEENLSIHLRSFLTSITPQPVEEEEKEEDVSISEHESRLASQRLMDASTEVEGWYVRGSVPSEREVISVLSQMFESRGYLITQREDLQREHSRRVDMGVWIDDMPSGVGDPLLIEIDMTRKEFRSAYRRFQQLLTQVGSDFGLLIRWEHDWNEMNLVERREDSPLIVAMSLKEVSETLLSETFEDRLWTLFTIEVL
jgi:hypothetical protein